MQNKFLLKKVYNPNLVKIAVNQHNFQNILMKRIKKRRKSKKNLKDLNNVLLKKKQNCLQTGQWQMQDFKLTKF